MKSSASAVQTEVSVGSSATNKASLGSGVTAASVGGVGAPPTEAATTGVPRQDFTQPKTQEGSASGAANVSENSASMDRGEGDGGLDTEHEARGGELAEKGVQKADKPKTERGLSKKAKERS